MVQSSGLTCGKNDVVIKLMFVPNVMTVATYCLGKSINFLCFLMKYKSFQGKILYKIYTT